MKKQQDKSDQCSNGWNLKMVQPVPVKGEGKVDPDFIEWCNQERKNFSNGMRHKFNWYALKPEQRVVAENFMICFDQLLDKFKSLKK